MAGSTNIAWLRVGALIILLLYAFLCGLIGLFDTFLPLVLSFHHGPVPAWRYILVGPFAALVGIATLFRLRLAAVSLSALFAFLGAEQLYGIAHGLSLPQPPHISETEIICMVGFMLLPSALTVFAWTRLRWMLRNRPSR